MKSVLKLNVASKIGLGFLLMVATLLFASMAGYISTSRLSSSLDYVTGPAWDTADGAMEGSIGIQSQIIATQEMVSAARGGVILDVSAQITEGKETADSALGRMFAAKQIPAELADKVKPLIADFVAQRDKTITATTAYVKAFNAMKTSASDFVQFMGLVEEIGDGAVEVLEKILSDRIL